MPTHVVGAAQRRWYPPRRDRAQEEPLSRDLGGSRILVTGAGGFIGSHLTEALLHEGASVRALVHYDSRGDWARLTHLIDAPPRRLEVRAGDVRDPFLIDSMVEGVDIVVHLAALVPIPASYLHRPNSSTPTSAARCTRSRRRAAAASSASSRHRAARSMAARATPRSTRRIPCRRSRPTRRARSAPARSPNRTTAASECR